MNLWTSVLFAAYFYSLNNGVMNGTMIKNASFQKHLGLIISNTGHVKSISEKSWSRLNLLRAPKFRVSRNSFENYTLHTYVLFWNIAILFGTVDLLTQNRYYMLFIWNHRSDETVQRGRLFMDLGWESLQTRRNKQIIQNYAWGC